MPYYAQWTRIEPDARTTDATRDAARALTDPFWALGRQWWVGEWRGFDGGTPQSAEISLYHSAISPDKSDGPCVPETALQSPPAPDAPDAWRHALRLAREAIAIVEAQLTRWDAILARDPNAFNGSLQRDAQSARDALADLPSIFPITLPQHIASRVSTRLQVDGRGLLDALRTGDVPGLQEMLVEFVASHPPHPPQQEAFSLETGLTQGALRTSDGTDLRAHTRAAPELHWSDIRPTRPEELLHDGGNMTVRAGLQRLRFEGDLPPRFWQSTPAATDYVGASAGPADFGHLMAASVFAEQGGTRWIASWDVPVPALVAPRWVTALDSFGLSQSLTVQTTKALTGWTPSPGSPYMTLLNTPGVIAGPVVEDMSLQIDELDNLLWAIEDVVLDDLGRGKRLSPGRAQPDVPRESYAARIAPPLNWTAYQRLADMRMERAILDGGAQAPHQRSALLRETLDMAPESVGPLGRRVQTHWCLARDAEGHRHLWRVHRASLGRPRGGSGLAHDQILKPIL